MDLSAACYFTLFPVLLFLWNEFSPSLFKQKFIRSYFLFVISVVIIVEITGIFLFREWGNTLNYRAIRYLLYPSDATASIEGKTIVIALAISVALILVWGFLFRKILFLSQNNSEKKWPAFSALIIIPLLFIGMRGGFRQISLSESNAYFSENNFLNQVALNKSWYFFRNVLNNVQRKKPFYFFPEYSQNNIHEKLYPKTEKFQVLNLSKPNIVLIVLEGWSTDIIETLGGSGSVVPYFDSISKEGLLFTNIYASGTRTDQGIMSILSGFPAMPDLSIVQDIEKSVKLPSLLKDFKSAEYFTSFIYGGEAEFCNFKTYFTSHGTDLIIDKYSFEKSQRTISWGVPDHLVLNRASQEISKMKEPFFTVILTQSTHEPYDSPVFNKEKITEKTELYKACASYTDSAIAKFINSCKSKPWFNNTLFVFVSDHSHRFPLNRTFNEHERFKIPLLFYGNVIDTAFSGKQISLLSNHHDIPATLLSQVDMDFSNYHFSKDMLSSNSIPFAYWCTDFSMGWLEAQQKVGINLHNASVFMKEKHQDATEEQKTGVGYLQEILKEYENY